MGFGTGTAAGVTAGTALAPFTGGASIPIGAGLGLLSDIFGLAMDYSAAKKQEKQTDYVNKMTGAQYNQEHAEERGDVAWKKGITDQSNARQAGLDRLTNQQNWLNNIAGIINKDQGLKKSFVAMSQSKTGRVW
jgi:hypothetical protein